MEKGSAAFTYIPYQSNDNNLHSETDNNSFWPQNYVQQKKSPNLNLNLNSNLQEEEEEYGSIELEEYRMRGFESSWKKCEQSLLLALSDLYSPICHAIIHFLNEARTQWDANKATVGMSKFLIKRNTMVAGLLVGPASLTPLFLQTFSNQLQGTKPLSPLIATLSPSSPGNPCSSLKLLLRAIFAIFKAQAEGDRDPLEDGRFNRGVGVVSRDLEMLARWYEEKFPQSQDEDETHDQIDNEVEEDQSRNNNKGPTLVVYLQNLDSFNPSVLIDLIHCLRSYSERLPLVLLFSTPTSASALRSILPYDSISQLEVAVFDIDRSVDGESQNKAGKKTKATIDAGGDQIIFERIIDAISMISTAPSSSSSSDSARSKSAFYWERPPLFLSPQLYRTLKQSWIETNRSIGSVISTLKYAYMEHFYGHITSAVAVLPPSSDNGTNPSAQSSNNTSLDDGRATPPIPSVSSHFSPADLSVVAESLRNLPSFRNAVDNAIGTTRKKKQNRDPDPNDSQESDNSTERKRKPQLPLALELQAQPQFLLKLLRDDAEMLNVASDIFASAHAERYMGWRIGAVVLEYMDEALTGGMTDQKTCETFSDRAMSRKVMEQAETLCTRLSASNQSSTIITFLRSTLLILAGAFSGSLKDYTYLHALGDLISRLYEHFEKIQELVLTGDRAEGFRNLINGNILGANPITKADKAYTKEIRDLATYLQVTLQKLFQPVENLCFHEVWYLQSHRSVREVVYPSATTMAEDALQNSMKYLSISSPSSTIDPDISDVYRLHMDAGKLVNIGDWYRAFHQLLNDRGETITDPRPSKQSKSRPSANAGPRRSSRQSQGREVQGDEESDDESDLTGETSRERQARFIASVGAMAAMGMIAPTRKKPNVHHVFSE